MKHETANTVNEFFTTGWIICYILFPPLLFVAAGICLWHIITDPVIKRGED